jgi:hypothetical protein
VSAFELVRTEAAGSSVKRLCRLLEVSRSGYYDHLTRRSAPSPEPEALCVAAIRTIHAECEGAYGIRRMHRELRAQGHVISRKRVRRLMQDNFG